MKYARQDLAAAKALFETKNVDFYRNIGFHCQQSAEKVMKAFLMHHKVKFGKVHDLKILGEEIVKIDSTIKGLMIRAMRLTPYAVEFRYPESSDRAITEDELIQVILLVEFIQQAIIDRIK